MRSRGSRYAIRATWLVAGSSTGSIPSGTAAGLRVTAAMRQVAGDRHELAQQVLDVGLVAGALAAEHVRVDDDERRHAATSR